MADLGISVNEKISTQENLGNDNFAVRFNAIALVRIVNGKIPQIVYHQFIKPDKSMVIAKKGESVQLPTKLEVR